MKIKCPNCESEGVIPDSIMGDVECSKCGAVFNVEDYKEDELNKNYIGAVIILGVLFFGIPCIMWWFDKLALWKTIFWCVLGFYLIKMVNKAFLKQSDEIDKRR